MEYYVKQILDKLDPANLINKILSKGDYEQEMEVDNAINFLLSTFFCDLSEMEVKAICYINQMQGKFSLFGIVDTVAMISYLNGGMEKALVLFFF